jgi:hypothetical protein
MSAQAPSLSAPARLFQEDRPAWLAYRRWALRFALVVMSLTSLPYLLAYARQGDAWRFTGFLFGVDDGNSYIAKMLSGMAGAWLFRTPYTAQPQRGVLAFLPYLLLGKLASQPGAHEQLVALFHGFRFGAGVLAILATADFIALFVRDERLRRWGLALAVLGGGLGWLLFLLGKSSWLGSMPLEFYSPESFGFLALYGLPHLALARALLLWGLAVYLRPALLPAWVRPGSRPWWDPAGAVIGLGWLLLGLFQPLTALIAWGVAGLHLAVLGAWQVWKVSHNQPPDWRTWRLFARRLVWAILLSAPIVVYTALTSLLDPFMRLWTSQNLILSPHPLHYLLAYGLLLPFAVLGAARLLRMDAALGLLPVAWVVALPVLAYAPYNLQRRLPEGLWVALVVLALLPMQGKPALSARDDLNESASRPSRAPGLRALLVFALLFPSTLLILAGGVLASLHPGRPVFQPESEVRTFAYLAENAPAGSVVLSAFHTGNPLPAWAPLRVVIGHGPESAGLAELEPQVSAFYQSTTSDAWRLALLRRLDVRYVYWGPDERALGDWDPGQAAYLRLLTRSGEYAVYAVQSGF